MTWGFEAVNQSGSVQVDGVHRRFRVAETFNASSTGLGAVDLYFQQGQRIPLIACQLGVGSIVSGVSVYRDRIRFTLAGSAKMAICHDSVLNTSGSGIQVFDSSGVLTFNSENTYFAASNVETVPIGAFVDYSNGGAINGTSYAPAPDEVIISTLSANVRYGEPWVLLNNICGDALWVAAPGFYVPVYVRFTLGMKRVSNNEFSFSFYKRPMDVNEARSASGGYARKKIDLHIGVVV